MEFPSKDESIPGVPPAMWQLTIYDHPKRLLDTVMSAITNRLQCNDAQDGGLDP
jgi:hypothetical protein